MIFKQLNFDSCLSYIVACSEQKTGAIIDPSHEIGPYIDKEPLFIFDVRESDELQETGLIAEAVSIPVREVAKRIGEFPDDLDSPIVIICESGIRSAHAASICAHTDTEMSKTSNSA